VDWFLVAKNDWEVYKDNGRISMFVLRGKITSEQYEEITGEPYSL
jgi:hypothetical protein